MSKITQVVAHEMGEEWAVECDDCGVLAVVTSAQVERYCVHHMDSHHMAVAS